MGNAYHLEGIPTADSPAILEPGISFFERPDQQHLFKLHLPYVWRTPSAVDTLFLPLLNRSAKGLGIQSGLVETDWYPSPVNLIIEKCGGSVHIQRGDSIAHAVLISRGLRRPTLAISPDHSRLSRDTRKSLAEWDKHHAKDRGAYKNLARENRDSTETPGEKS